MKKKIKPEDANAWRDYERTVASKLSVEDWKKAMYICLLVSTTPEPTVPSVARSCDRCGESVWVDKKTTDLQLKSAVTICIDCFKKEFKDKIK